MSARTLGGRAAGGLGLEPVVDRVVVVQPGRPGIGRLRATVGGGLEAAQRPFAPAHEVGGQVAEGPLAHRAGFGHAVTDVGDQVPPLLLVRFELGDKPRARIFDRHSGQSSQPGQSYTRRLRADVK